MSRLALILLSGMLLFLAACGGAKKPAATSPGPGPTETPTAPSAPSATAETSPAGDAFPPTIGSREAAAAARPLALGSPWVLDDQSIVYYRVGCWSCGGASVDLWRAYVSPVSGALKRERLFNFESTYTGTRYSFAADWDAGEMVVAVCTRGYGGGEDAASSDAANVLLRSKDGGVSWLPVGSLPPNTHVVGFLHGRMLLWTYDGPGQSIFSHSSFTWWPSGEALLPPTADRRFYPAFVEGEGLVWFDGHGTYLNSVGNEVLAPLFRDRVAGRLWLHVLERPERVVGWTFVEGGQRRRHLSLVAPDSTVIQTWGWSAEVLDVAGALGDRLFYAVVLVPDSPTGSEQTPLAAPARRFPLEAAVVDLTTGTVHLMAQLSEPLEGNNNPFIARVITGSFARVNTGGDCLHVRESPATSARSLGCFRPGVLLRDRGETQEADGLTWAAVTTPAGEPGWAAAQYLER